MMFACSLSFMDQENFLQLYVFMLNEYLNLISS